MDRQSSTYSGSYAAKHQLVARSFLIYELFRSTYCFTILKAKRGRYNSAILSSHDEHNLIRMHPVGACTEMRMSIELMIMHIYRD